jgi:hypothetical protein
LIQKQHREKVKLLKLIKDQVSKPTPSPPPPPAAYIYDGQITTGPIYQEEEEIKPVYVF